MQLDNVLTILDKPKNKQWALARARSLQKALGASLELASFCQMPLLDSEVFDAKERREVKRRLGEERSEWLAGVAEQQGVAEYAPHVVWSDQPVDWVFNHIDNHPVDLVIKSRDSRDTRSANDWRLLRECPVPLLLTSRNTRSAPGPVLAAIDLRHRDAKHRRLNKQVLEAAAKFAEATNRELHCVTAIEVSAVLRDLDIIDERKAAKRFKDRTKAELDKLLTPYDVPAKHRHFPIGKVGRCVSGVARKLKVSTLVVGSYTDRLSTFIGLGNSAERILGRAVGDVLVIHPS